jgi:branched-chain amino acid transport system substrate-binding protein
MRNSLTLVLSAIVTFCLVACNGKQAGKPGEAEPIKIGHYASLTGGTATFGRQTDDGIKLAVDEINSSGGLLGRKIDLITEDTKSEKQDAISAVEKLLVSDKVSALIGEVASTRSLAGAPIADREKIPMLSPASTNEMVTLDKNGKARPYVFRICFIDPFQGTAMAKFAHDVLKVNRVAIITDNKQDYSVGLSKSFRETFTSLGGQVVAEQSYESDDKDFKAQLTDVKAKNPEAIFVSGYYQEVSLLAPQARALGITVPLLGGDGWDSPVLTEGEAKQALEGCYFSNHYSEQDTSARVRDFISRYQAKYKEVPGAMAALGYDAMNIIAKVIKDAGKADPESIRAGLEKLTNYPGVTGNISIDEKHNARKPLVVLQIKGGKFTYATTINP